MDIEAYILIGGRSSRLGRDKAFVEIGGRTLAQRALKTVRESGIAAKTTFVAGSQTQFAIEALTLDAPFIFDMVEGRGPLGGLHAALSYARTEWVFVLACDYPLISTEFLKCLKGLVSDEFGAVVPEQSDKRLQPLCAFYTVDVASPIIEKIIGQPSVSPPLREIVRELNTRVVTFDEYRDLSNSNDFFININTQENLKLLREMDHTDSI